MNARDALDLGLADRFLLDDQQEQLLEGLLQLNWQEQTAMQLNSLLKALQQEAIEQMPEAQWLPRRQQIWMNGWMSAMCAVPGAPSVCCVITPTCCWPAPRKTCTTAAH